MPAKFLFVVHRYAPFPGGSENYVRDMAEELVNLKHDVTVLTHEHKGDLNGVKVTSDYQIMGRVKYDLIIVHGADCISQNIALYNIETIPSPVCYMIIKPSISQIAMKGLSEAKFLSYSTDADISHIRMNGFESKARRIRHGIVPKTTLNSKNSPYVLDRKYYTSAGGYYPHKAMVPLADYWKNSRTKKYLVLDGYGEGKIPPESFTVFVNQHRRREDVLKTIAGSNGYIMNSYEEGFGLVLLEAMLNKVPVYSRNVGAAKEIPYVMVYEKEEELIPLIEQFESYDEDYRNNWVKCAYNHVMTNHTITQTVNDILDIVTEAKNEQRT